MASPKVPDKPCSSLLLEKQVIPALGGSLLYSAAGSSLATSMLSPTRKRLDVYDPDFWRHDLSGRYSHPVAAKASNAWYKMLEGGSCLSLRALAPTWVSGSSSRGKCASA